MVFWEILFILISFLLGRKESSGLTELGKTIQIVYVKWLWADAFTVGRVIFTRLPPPISMNFKILHHELVHVDQWEKSGFFFPFLYIFASIKALFQGKHFYYGNEYEEEAYSKQSRR